MEKYYKVGDRVRIVNQRNRWWDADGRMDKRRGEVMTIQQKMYTPMGIMYFMVEDECENNGRGWAWSARDFVGKVAFDAPVAEPMPKLTTGMFGMTDDGDYFVVVGNLIVFQIGGYAVVGGDGKLTKLAHPIVALYQCNCFTDIHNGTARLLWESPDYTRSARSGGGE